MTFTCRATPLLALFLLGTASCNRDSAPGVLSRPSHVAVSADGQVLVADFHNARVVRFDDKGGVQSSVGSRGFGDDELWGVGDIGVLPSGGFAVVDHARASLDELDTPRPQVKIFGATGQELRVFTTLIGVDSASLPSGLAVSKAGVRRAAMKSAGEGQRVLP